jgi:hypothetical protein
MPHGFDLGLGTAGAGLALLAWPITSHGGAVLAYNVLALAAPAVAATTAYVFAHAVTNRFAPSLVGGWIFGFSSYEFGHLLGHLPLAFTGLLPLVPYLLLRRQRGTIRRRRFVVSLAFVLACQFLIVTQLFFSAVLLGAIAAVTTFSLFGRDKNLGSLDAATALILATILVSPVLAYAAVSHAAAPARSPFAESADLLNFFVPTHRTWLHTTATDAIAARFTGTGAELGTYLGFPFLALVALAALRRPRTRARLLLVALLLASAILSLGTRVKVAGIVIGIGPWAVLARLPLVGSALPARLTLYTSLFAGLLVALALADRPSKLRWTLAVCGIVATLPNLQLPAWQSRVPQPVFFTADRYAAVIPRNATVLVLPYGPAGWSMLWQAESHFRFRVVGGHFGLRVTPEERSWRDVYAGLGSGRVRPRRLRAFLAAHGVTRIVVTAGTRRGARRLARAAAGVAGHTYGDAVVYTLEERSA